MLQEIRKMRFEEVYIGWTESRLNPEDRHILEVYASENGVIHPLKAGAVREP